MILKHALVFALVCSVVAPSHAQSKTEKSEPRNECVTCEQRGTEEKPIIVKTVPDARTEQESTREKQVRLEESAVKGAVKEALRTLAEESVINTKLTVVLCIIAGIQGALFIWQLFVMRRMLNDAERSTNASVAASMPFLYPRVTKLNLYPDSITDNTVHVPSLMVVFENFGKTPAILRRIGIHLLVSQNDALPAKPMTIDEIGGVERGDVIAASARGVARDWQLDHSLHAQELRELAGDTKGQYRRIYFTGYVEYDDFFETRHTHIFCMKVTQNGFQRVRGGERFNGIVRRPIPRHEETARLAEE